MSLGKRLIGWIAMWSASGLFLAGCVASEPAAEHPANPYDYPTYPQDYYGGYTPPGYYTPAYPYGPYFGPSLGPSLGFGFGGGFREHDEHHRRDRHRDHGRDHDQDHGPHPGPPPPSHAAPTPPGHAAAPPGHAAPPPSVGHAAAPPAGGAPRQATPAGPRGYAGDRGQPGGQAHGHASRGDGQHRE